MIDLKKPKYNRSILGVKVRAHRMVIQVAATVAFIYLFGWLAFFLAMFIFLIIEIAPYKNWERWLNPWLHRECQNEEIGAKLSDSFEDWLQKEIERDFGDDEV